MNSKFILMPVLALSAASLAAANCIVMFKDPFGSVLKTVSVAKNALVAQYAPPAPPGTTITGWTPTLGRVVSNTVYTCTMTGGEGYVGSSGTKVTAQSVLARGGNIVYRLNGSEGYEYVHIYTNTARVGSFKNNTGKNLKVRFLAVGGGGAGGYGEWQAYGGGGGGGGIVIGGEDLIAPNANWFITVGAGGCVSGTVEACSSSIGTSDSIANIACARGGGAGGHTDSRPDGGGTGGGGTGDSRHRTYDYKIENNRPDGAPGFANSECDGEVYARSRGADALKLSVSTNVVPHFVLPGGGGGGGASAPVPSSSEFRAGNGGLGVYSSITGDLRVYGGGGGGGGGICFEFDWKMDILKAHPDGLLPGIGAYGGGGGGLGTTRVPDGNWVANKKGADGADGYGCGGGGGGAGDKSIGGRGGSGIVILRYREVEAPGKPEPEPAPGHVASSTALEDFMRPTVSSEAPVEVTLGPEYVLFDQEQQGDNITNSFAARYTNLIAAAVQAGKSVVFNFRDGTYNMPIYQNWDFLAGFSGTPSAPVIFRAENPGKVRFFGDTALAKSSFNAIAASDLNYNRFPAQARANILVAEIPSSIVAIPTNNTLNCGENAPQMQVYLDGEIQECARWPNRQANGCVGWTNYVECLDASDDSAVKIRLPDNRATRWADITAPTNGVFIHGSFVNPWDDEFVRVKKLENGRDITFAARLQAKPAKGSGNQIQRFAVVNAAEELDSPGEWWFDTVNRMFYYYPKEPDFLTSPSELYLVSNRGALIDFSGAVHDVRFEGIEFAYADYICEIQDRDARRIEFKDCYFHSFRKDSMIRGSDIAFRRCKFEHFCGGVLQFRYNENWRKDPALSDIYYHGCRSLESCRNLCEDCEFIDFQHTKVSGTRAIQAYRTGCAVRNCLFDGGGHSAIIFRGNEIFMGWCRSRNCLRETIDASVFYTHHNTTYLGNIILGCDFRDSRPLEGSCIRPESADKRASALYLDDATWGGDFIGCTVDNLRQGLWLRGGNLHTFAWNRFTNCGLGMRLDATCADDRTFNFLDEGTTTETWFGSFVATSGIDVASMRWRAAYPDFAATLNDAATRRIPWNNLVMGNALADCGQFFDCAADQYTPSMTFTNNYVIGNDGVFTGHDGFGRLPSTASTRDVPGMEEALARIAALSNATPVEAFSPNGRTRVRFMPDPGARLCIRVDIDGRDFLWPSETGLTVDGIDYGRMVRPVNIQVGGASSGIAIGREYTPVAFDLERVLDGSRAASVEAEVYDSGVRYRYRVRGSTTTNTPGFTVWRVAEGVEAVTAGEDDEASTYSEPRPGFLSSVALNPFSNFSGVVGPWRTVSTNGTLRSEGFEWLHEAELFRKAVEERKLLDVDSVDFRGSKVRYDETGVAQHVAPVTSVLFGNADPRCRYGYRKAATLEGLRNAEVVYPDEQPTELGKWLLEIEGDDDESSAFYQFVITPL